MEIRGVKLGKDKKVVIFTTDGGVRVKTEYGSDEYKWYVSVPDFTQRAERQLRGIHRKLFGFSKEDVEEVYLTDVNVAEGVATVYFSTNFGREETLSLEIRSTVGSQVADGISK